MIMLATMHLELPWTALPRLGAVIGAGLLLAVSGASAQPQPAPPAAQLQSPAQAQPQPPAQPPAVIEATPVEPAPRAGLPALPTPPEMIGAIGRFIDQSVTNLRSGVDASVRGAGEAIGGAAGAASDLAKGAGDAAGSVVRLPTNVVRGWEKCAVAPNGAPDCAVASVAMCRAKGYQRGNSLDITSSRKCPAQVWLQGRQPTDAECVNESFVSRAVCQ
jgi:hypothetical protein